MDIPPLRERDEASLAAVLCLLFNLRRSEGQVLMLMSTQDFVSKEEIHAAASQNEQTIAEATVSVLISGLRKKLIVYGIEISTLRGFGYGLRKESRVKICRRLAKYDAGLIPTTPQSKLKAPKPDASCAAPPD
jgi:DNA-binding winged helix-turn-helix (wHTH) protein